jgi:hypothetical protein
MATSIAHKGLIVGAKVQAITMLDILLDPDGRRKYGIITTTYRLKR